MGEPRCGAVRKADDRDHWRTEPRTHQSTSLRPSQDLLQTAATIVEANHKIQNSIDPSFFTLPRWLHRTSSLDIPLMGIDPGILVTDRPINMYPKTFLPTTMCSYVMACVSATCSFNSIKRARCSRMSEYVSPISSGDTPLIGRSGGSLEPFDRGWTGCSKIGIGKSASDGRLLFDHRGYSVEAGLWSLRCPTESVTNVIRDRRVPFP